MTDTAIVLSTTESVCPICLARLPAERVMLGDDVYLLKTCPEHGPFQTILWRGQQPAYIEWAKPKIPAYPAHPTTQNNLGCPFDCGLCPDHRQQTCTALLEVTQRCDLRCPFCFADAGINPPPDPDLATIEGWYRRLLEAGGNSANIQLSGGEPTLRDDLPDIVALGKSLGFQFIQVNTNGLRLGRDADYVKRLKQAGLSSVFMQFDGTHDDVLMTIRGVKQLDRKRVAIECCAENDLVVILVPTLVLNVNTGDIGDIIEFALDYFPTVRGVHFQPVSYFGRYPQIPSDADRITIPEVIRLIETQTGGKMKMSHFTTSGCENALCSLHGNFVVMPDGELRSWSQQNASGCCTPQPAEIGATKTRQFVAQFWSSNANLIALDSIRESKLGDWDVFLARTKTHTFCVSGMAFQDAWNLDLERLRECCIHTVSPDGRLIPFCAYNLTDQMGRSIYRNQQATIIEPCG
ncbi:MAG: radical SAM protein [Anaerolineae bacterium]|nr:radical SAM protein [Anaerolineae bacterium]